MPTISAQPSIEAQNRAPADFSSLVADSWLQLLHACTHTAHALQTSLRAALAAGSQNAGLYSDGRVSFGGESGTAGEVSFSGMTGTAGPGVVNPVQAQQQAMLAAVESRARSLQVALSKVRGCCRLASLISISIWI